jgi:hypothetical protein
MGLKPNYREEQQLLLVRKSHWGILRMSHRRVAAQALDHTFPHMWGRFEATQATTERAP